MDPAPISKTRRRVWYVILFVPFFVALWVPLYNRVDPALFGVPFFYWFQFILIAIGAVITGLVYKARV